MMINVLKNLKKLFNYHLKNLLQNIKKLLEEKKQEKNGGAIKVKKAVFGSKLDAEAKKEVDGGFIDMTKDKKYFKGRI
jgi:hypothetical protein